MRREILAYVVIGALLGGLGVWGAQALWTHAGELDAKPPGNGLKKRLMQRKSAAMHDLLDAMLDGELGRVAAAAGEVEEHATSIENFLSTDMYDEHGAEFFEAVQAVRKAAGEGELEATKEATLRLERSCLDCHQQLNEHVDAGQWR